MGARTFHFVHQFARHHEPCPATLLTVSQRWSTARPSLLSALDLDKTITPPWTQIQNAAQRTDDTSVPQGLYFVTPIRTSAWARVRLVLDESSPVPCAARPSFPMATALHRLLLRKSALSPRTLPECLPKHWSNHGDSSHNKWTMLFPSHQEL